MRYAALVTVLGLLSTLVGCGGAVSIFATTGRNTGFASTSGTVSIVQLSTGSGGTVITVVTLLSGVNTQTMNFCGNVVSQFPLNTFVTVNFNQGTPCSTVVQVIV